MTAFFQQYGRYVSFISKFIAVDDVSPQVQTDPKHRYWDGFIGIAPYTSDPLNKDRNFMFQLKAQGKIDHNTVSFYINLGNHNSSSIKFGSYDNSGIANGAIMAVYRTIDKTKWSIYGEHFKANGHKVAEMREISFDMQLPYLYIPKTDFLNFAVSLAIFDVGIKCSSKENSCKYKKPCDQVDMKTWYLAFDIYDSEIRNNYAIPSSSNFLINGDLLGDPGTCYLPVFESVNGD